MVSPGFNMDADAHLDQINKQKKFLKKKWKKKLISFFSIFESVKSPEENVQFPDSPDFEIFPDLRTWLDRPLEPQCTYIICLVSCQYF